MSTTSRRVPRSSVANTTLQEAPLNGLPELYGWLNERDVLIVKADRQEPLVVVLLSLAAEVAKSQGCCRPTPMNETELRDATIRRSRPRTTIAVYR
jgi:hypothetical protein